jgi:hypothetical protein
LTRWSSGQPCIFFFVAIMEVECLYYVSITVFTLTVALLPVLSIESIALVVPSGILIDFCLSTVAMLFLLKMIPRQV